MNKQVKKILAYLLVFMLIVTGLYFPANKAHATNNSYITNGSKVYKSTSDVVTNVPTFEELNSGAGAFMKEEGNGRIWVDKSVVEKGNGSFEVDLSAITQEYISTVTSTSTSNTAADVVFVLDGSGSMVTTGSTPGDIDDNGVKMQRLEAMVKATNEAINIIMDANPKNRVSVYVYSETTVYNMLPMDSYTIKENAKFPNNYLVWGNDYYGVTHLPFAIYLNDELVDGKGNDFDKFMPTNEGNFLLTSGGTAPQAGIASGITGALKNVSSSTDIGERIPFAFLLSDGGATYGQTAWWDNDRIIRYPGASNNASNGGIGSGNEYKLSTNQREPQLEDVTATLILSAAKLQDELSAGYKEYNESFGYAWGAKNETAKFYTVGLGSDINGPYVRDEKGNEIEEYYKCAWMGLNPEDIEKVLAGEKIYPGWSDKDLVAAQIAAQAVKDKITEYFNLLPNDVTLNKDYSQPENYNYADYYAYAESYNVLSEAFNQLAKDVASQTREIKAPVTEQTINSSNASIHFKDIIGEGFEIDTTSGIDIVYEGNKTIHLTKNPAKDNEFISSNGTFEGKVVLGVENGMQVLEWYITANDMKKCLIQILDFDATLTEEQMQKIVANKKLNLKFKVNLKDTAFQPNKHSFYTNAYANDDLGTTSVTYLPALDNNYYYYTIDKVGIVGDLASVGFPTEDNNMSHFVKGEKIPPVTASTLYSNVYITTDIVNADSKDKTSTRKLTSSMIGTVMDITSDVTDTEFNKKLSDSLMNCISAVDADKSSNEEIFAYRSGNQKVHDHTVSKKGTNFDNNKTSTASLVSQESFENGLITMKLGNNGRVDGIVNISLTGTEETVPGESVEYKILVNNPLNKPITNIVVEDIIPSELKDIVVSNASISGNKYTWTIPEILAGQTVELVITGKLRNDTSVVGFENTASITKVENVELPTPAVSNTIETKIIRNIEIDVNKDNSDWIDHGKVFQFVGNGKVYELTDPIPDGTYDIVEKLASSTKDTGRNVKVTGGAGEGIVDYYTLTVKYDENINSIQETSGLGESTSKGINTYIFLKGESAVLKPLVKQGYEIKEWVYDKVQDSSVDSHHILTMPMTKAETVIVSTNKLNSIVTVTSRLDDGQPWDGFGLQKLTLVDTHNNEVTNFDNVPDGEYTLKINNTMTSHKVTVDSSKSSNYTITVDYYSLSLGIATGTDTDYITSFEGVGVYLKGSTVHMHANVEHSKAHFVKWEITEGKDSSEIVPGKENDECSNITINTKTKVLASADTPPKKSSPLIIRVYRDRPGVDHMPDYAWNEQVSKLTVKYINNGVEELVIDKGNLANVGTYRIYDGNKLAKTFEVPQETIDSAKKIEVDVDYFTLTLKTDTGINSVSGNGIYLENEKVTINAEVNEQYQFAGWTGTTNYQNIENDITMNQTVTLTATATPYNTLHVLPKLDGRTYVDYKGEIKVKDQMGNIYTDLSKLADGIYYIHLDENDVPFGKISLDSGVTQSFDVNYYTLTLTTNTGIDTVNGAGIYLSGTEVEIDATSLDKFEFTNWSGSHTFTDKVTKVTMDKPLNYTANAKQVAFSVTINVNKDNQKWNDFKGAITLKDKEGNVPKGLTKVANGTYTVQVDGVDTYLKVTVNNNDATSILDYYTVTLDKDAGIGNVIGAGTYLKGANVNIEAKANVGYVFSHWLDRNNTIISSNKTLVKVDQPLQYKATSKKAEYSVLITPYKDGQLYTEFKAKMTLKASDGKIISDFSKIENDTYIVQVDGKDTYLEVTVDNNHVNAILDYYTLTLDKDEGIESVSGNGVYLKWTSVDINAIIKTKYEFNNWSGSSEIETIKSTVVMDEKLEYKANSTQVLFDINIQVNKDDVDYVGFDKGKLTLKDSKGAIFEDMTNVPSGQYIVQVNNEDTYLEIEVKDSDVEATLDYYSLALERETSTTSDYIKKFEGMGVYLKGSKVHMHADVNHSKSTFVEWKIISGNQSVIDKNDKGEVRDKEECSDIFLNTKTTVSAKANNTPKESSPLIIRVNKDDQSWNEQVNKLVVKYVSDTDEIIISDKGNLTLVGTYKIYDGDKKVEEFKLTQDDVKNGVTKTVTIDYYTLSLEKGVGIQSVKGQGTYVKGTKIEIKAITEEMYSFVNWTGSSTLAENPTTVIVDKPLSYRANAKQSKFNVTIPVNKDDKEYIDFDKVITLKDKENNIISDLTKVPNGSYTVQVDGVDTYLKVEVKDGDIEKTLDYYTLSLSKKEGVASTSGQGVYLKGTEVDIKAVIEDTHSFVNWTGESTLTKNPSTITVDKMLSYIANAKQSKFNVTIQVNKDDKEDLDFGKEITLKDKENNIISDLTKVPNGNYVVQVDGSDTYLKVEVKDGDVKKLLEYYTLTLDFDEGIESVKGAGTYLRDTKVDIESIVKDKFEFSSWSGDHELIQNSSIITMSSPLSYKANTKQTKFGVSIHVNKDDEIYENYQQALTLVDEESNTYHDLTSIPNGNYTVQVEGKNTYLQITVKDNHTNATLDYYSVTLIPGTGIQSVTGQGVYLKNSTVNIDAKTEDGYIFKDWRGDKSFDQANSTFKLEGKVSLEASAKEVIVPPIVEDTYNVNVEVNKDNQPWNDFDQSVTLKSKDGTIFTDLTKVPNGKYIVCINDVPTNKTIEIVNTDTTIILNYYTLSLEIGEGIKEVIGSGIYLEGTHVDIKAMVIKGYQFINWTGDYTIDKKSVSLSIDGTIRLKANAKQPSSAVETGDNTVLPLSYAITLAGSCIAVIGLLSIELKKQRHKQMK